MPIFAHMKHTRIKFAKSNIATTLLSDYLDGAPDLSDCYGLLPKSENILAQIEIRKQFPINRAVLAKQLAAQYKLAGLKPPSETIERLLPPNSYTIVTGHQLSLFAGPLYFIYKINQVIQLAEDLRMLVPDCDFIPVFWMATEDHDFAEINHFVLNEQKITWDVPASGAVGRLASKDFEVVYRQLAIELGPGERAGALLQIFERAYMESTNLANATRVLVSHLFANRNLLIVDGDDPSLKALASPFFKRELLEGVIASATKHDVQKLNERYYTQTHIRDINLFYLTDNDRKRLVRSADGDFFVDGTTLRFSVDALEKELKNHPERFSPNVNLRPIYQEIVLPNLMYVGGGGEVAYWLQLRGAFEAFKVPQPMIMMRHSFLFLSKRANRKMKKLGLSPEDLFEDRHRLEARLIQAASDLEIKLDPFKAKLDALFADLRQLADLTEKSMLGAVAAQHQKQLNGLDKLEKKLLKAEKRRNGLVMRQLDEILTEAFPGGTFQERKVNFAQFYMAYGPDWMKHLNTVSPWDTGIHVFQAE
jgi:bacillithiol synthase